ncbi:clathrin adaptor complex small chain (macronuclear) [Tetrahymena thermophila SB210]|uniref:Coatomer subunit zeta n=1 Tax=Tetrahymena thermophila (strain SB210) TaxID=312017 RepID=Q23CT0_TETTS|nr:clathrin adaptor complex small chain [Tetrahymena thermophila SB210]EAR94478.2 clathrin adaptor complex small chain [Tetrahymena thermophila SB210]|eukprot:XP_001014956.2 clathrin adaptor complex small chain [Tetrahymena thermophila SB210]
MSTNSKQPLSSSISKVFSVAVLRNDGSRIYSKYYNSCFPDYFSTVKEGDLKDLNVQKAFEKNIFEKSRKLVNIKAMKPSDTEIFGYGRFTILFKILSDVQIYIIADPDENEALLAAALKCLVDSMSNFSKEQINNKIVCENYEGLILIIDEIIDQGIIVNIEPGVIISRYTMLDCDDALSAGVGQSQANTTSSSQNSQSSSISTQASSTVGFLKSLFNR